MTHSDYSGPLVTDGRPNAWSWDQTRELYTDWAAGWADSSGIKEVLRWRGFPLWWASNLIHKDTSLDYAWYKELHDRLCGAHPTRVRPRSDFVVCLGLLKSLARELGKWVLLRLLPPRGQRSDASVWFHGLEYNLLSTREGFCDRMYEQAPLDDRKYGFLSGYIIRLNFRRADFLHPWCWRARIAGLSGRLKREVEILDRYSRVTDIVEIHWSLLRSYFAFRRFIDPLRTQGIRIAHAEFADILVLEMQKSFVSYIPFALTYAAMFERWMYDSRDRKTLITYGETLAWIRPVYHVTQKNAAGHRWVSIQHATVYRNKMGFYHRFSEFNRLSPDDTRSLSPKPDFYFVHGPQFAEILGEYYPLERARIIGCLKYDRLHRLYGQSTRDARSAGADRVMLLAPSTGDEEIILKMFSGLQSLPGWRVMLSKHPVVSQDIIVEIIRRNEIALPIDFDASKSTIQLIETANLVVCSSSGMALESHFLGVPSIRVVNPELPPVVEDEPGIAYVTTQLDLLKVISALPDSEQTARTTSEMSETLARYFFRFDGLASQRFWTQLTQITAAVDGSVAGS